jgi:four helix bundle protein
MTELFGYRRLKVWQEAHSLVLLVYKVTKQFPREELFGLTSQLRRSAVSVPANIVEGYARRSKNELKQFLVIAQGSLSETEYYLELIKDLQYISEDDYTQLTNQRHLVGNLLHGLMASVIARK